jgi:hypothetical protein
MIRYIVVHKTVTCVYCTEGLRLEDQLLACIRSVRQSRMEESAMECCYHAMQLYFQHRNGIKGQARCLVCKVETHGE